MYRLLKLWPGRVTCHRPWRPDQHDLVLLRCQCHGGGSRVPLLRCQRHGGGSHVPSTHGDVSAARRHWILSTLVRRALPTGHQCDGPLELSFSESHKLPNVMHPGRLRHILDRSIRLQVLGLGSLHHGSGFGCLPVFGFRALSDANICTESERMGDMRFCKSGLFMYHALCFEFARDLQCHDLAMGLSS